MNYQMLLNALSPQDNQANQVNPNKGTPGTNKQYDKAQGNRGKQMNPNQQKIAARESYSDDMDDGDVFWYDSSD